MKENILFIPVVKEIREKKRYFKISSDLFFHTSPDFPSEIITAARDILPISFSVKKSTSIKNQFSFFLSNQSKITQFKQVKEKLQTGGYILNVKHSGIFVQAEDRDGLFNALKTLRQILLSTNKKIKSLSIKDWPSFQYRGFMLDVSRGYIPKMETFRWLIKTLGELKYNVFSLYIEHVLAFKKHPDIWKGTGALTKKEIKEIVEYGKLWGVEVVPSFQSFGHFRNILKIHRYKKLAEDEKLWLLSPVEKGTYKLLKELYEEILPLFPSKFFNVCCDETVGLGEGKSKKKAKKIGKGGLFLQHILWLYDLLSKYNKKLLLWGDMLLEFPEIYSKLPEDIIILNWDYDDRFIYPSVRLTSHNKLSQWVCPGTNNWLRLFPDLKICLANINSIAKEGLNYNAEGLMLTEWGDGGTIYLKGGSWYPIGWNAEVGWNGKKAEQKNFDERITNLFFGRKLENISKAIHLLGKTNKIFTGEIPLYKWGKHLNWEIFFAFPFEGEFFEGIKFAKINKILEKAKYLKKLSKEANVFLKKVNKTDLNPEIIESMQLLAKQTEYISEKIIIAQKIYILYQKMFSFPGNKKEVINSFSQIKSLLNNLKKQLEQIHNWHEKIYLSQAKGKGKITLRTLYENSENKYDKLIKSVEKEKNKFLSTGIINNFENILKGGK